MPYRRRIKWTLFATQSFGSAGVLISSTVTPIVGAALSGRATWAGVPNALYWGGGACFAFLWGRLMDPIGRRPTIALGLTAGIVGSIVAALAVIGGSFFGLIGGLALMGGANTALQLARFVAAEVHPREQRGRAISTVVLGGTVGGVLGPLLVATASRTAEGVGLPGLAGPYLVGATFFVVGTGIVLSLLRPEPRDVARELARSDAGVAERPPRSLAIALQDGGVLAAMLSMVLAQGVMSTLMVISSLHMRAHDHTLGSIAGVMSSHVIGMYGLSLFTGRLADAWGRGPLITAGGILLLFAGLGATQAIAVMPMALVLFTLGLGWNLCYVGGSTLLADRLTQAERSRIQGVNDALLTSASALGSLLSGIAFSSAGYPAIGVTCAVIALLPVLIGWRFTGRRAGPAVSHPEITATGAE